MAQVFEPIRGTKCLVTVTNTGGTNEDPPVLYPPVPCEIVYTNWQGSHPQFVVKLMADVPGAPGWGKGDTYRASKWQLKPAQ